MPNETEPNFDKTSHFFEGVSFISSINNLLGKDIQDSLSDKNELPPDKLPNKFFLS